MEIIPAVDGAELARVGDRDRKLSEAARLAIATGKADRTRETYDWRVAEFQKWCDGELRTALPATAETLAEYVTVITSTPTKHGKPVAARSVEQVIAALRTWHREAGFSGQPDTTAALDVLRGYRRRRAREGHRERKSSPITLKLLRRMVEATPRHTPAGVRDRFLLVLGWSMLARRSELTALEFTDIEEVEDGLTVLVRASKTDQDAKGVELPVPHGQFRDTDPVRLFRAWRNELQLLGVSGGRVFRAIDRHGNVRGSLSDKSVNAIVRDAAIRAELPRPETFTAHSLRAGCASELADQDVPISVITEAGRWRAGSPVVLGYVRGSARHRESPLRGIGL